MSLSQLGVLIRLDLAARRTLRGYGILQLLGLPLAQFGVYAFVFTQIFKARVPGLDGQGYIAFLSIGMWMWFAFSEAVSRGATALSDNAGLCSKTAISLPLLVAARVVTAFAVHGVGLLVVMAVLALARIELDWMQFPVLLASWLLLLLLAFALAIVAAVLVVFARDFQQIVPLLLTVAMFLSPILYSLSMLPAWGHALQWLNPPGLAIAYARDAMLPGVVVQSWALAGATAGCALLGMLAWAMFRRLRPVLVDYL
jgi:lipopolysaccharide transport system permease protein